MTADPDACDLLCLGLAKAERVRHGLGGLQLELPARGARALGDPTRLRLAAAMLAAEELCVCDLAWIVERSDKLVSHHLRILREAGVAEARRDGKIVFYQLTDTGRRLLGAIAPDVLEVSA